MPFYWISFTIRSRTDAQEQTIVAYRQYPETDIDKVWHQLHVKCQQKYGGSLKVFDCVSFSKRSTHYQAYLRQEHDKKHSGSDKIEDI